MTYLTMSFEHPWDVWHAAQVAAQVAADSVRTKLQSSTMHNFKIEISGTQWTVKHRMALDKCLEFLASRIDDKVGLVVALLTYLEQFHFSSILNGWGGRRRSGRLFPTQPVARLIELIRRQR